MQSMERGQIGTNAARFSLNDMQGKHHSNETYIGKWLLLVFHRHLN